ncbi:MAG TPA: 3-oxoacyl-[acyl-carrier-protein] synthase III C-terminal domain-containing protein [Gemmatimonadaceae bacterium]|nr:3-oxoacyl-[acyl-carrier-protein] synthase III C-terminal domain-containing protein [Gemmatimonadaceae bacterium]
MTARGISGIGYAFPAATRSVRELAAAGALQSEATLLERFGFDLVHVAQAEAPYDLALRAARSALERSGADPESIGLVVYGGASAASAYVAGGNRLPENAWRTTARFRYPAPRLQYELGLTRASVLGIDQLACTTLFGAVRVAGAICEAERIDRALCIAAEFFPPDAGREAIFNCTSDAACALLLQRGAARNRIVASVQVTKGYYWDCDAMRDEVVASYFPTAAHVVARAIVDAGWQPADVDWVIPHNVSARSWQILLGLLRLPRARLWDANIALRGHALAGDNFINLHDAQACGDVREGDRLILFSYGYGAQWTALAIEA